MRINCISEYEKVIKRFDDYTFNHIYFMDSTSKFNLIKCKEGKYPAIITISGFWSEGEDNIKNWQHSITKAFPNQEWFHLEWNTRKKPMNKLSIDKSIKSEQITKYNRYVKIYTFARKYLSIVNLAINNDWHLSVRNSKHAWQFLADILTACGHKEFILVGHSLGARVIHNCLEHITSKNIESNINDVFLLGGAVNSRNKKWENAIRSIKNSAYNYYSKNDGVLKEIYGAVMIDDYPIGLHGVNLSKFKNIDASKYIKGHTEYIPNFHIIKNK